MKRLLKSSFSAPPPAASAPTAKTHACSAVAPRGDVIILKARLSLINYLYGGCCYNMDPYGLSCLIPHPKKPLEALLQKYERATSHTSLSSCNSERNAEKICFSYYREKCSRHLLTSRYIKSQKFTAFSSLS
jgi:hypothetical protein